jgi:hypothetical protein
MAGITGLKGVYVLRLLRVSMKWAYTTGNTQRRMKEQYKKIPNG